MKFKLLVVFGFVLLCVSSLLVGSTQPEPIYTQVEEPFLIESVEPPMIKSVISGNTCIPPEETPLSEYVKELEHTINISERVDHWTCYDYSVDFENNNPDWDCVTMSQHRFFYGASHMINYQFYDDRMIIYDGMHDNMYYVNSWDNDYNYYHFWQDNTPIRTYRFLLDNRGVVA